MADVASTADGVHRGGTAGSASEPAPTERLAGFAELARRRRTNLRIDLDRAVADDVIVELCDLAQWAPNHHRTWPWRFAALRGEARAELGRRLAEDMAARGAEAERVAKAATKYLRAPVMLAVAVGHQPDDGAERRAEDRDAVAAGVQNLLLGATAAGLASYWGSGAVLDVEAVKELCGFEPTDTMVALIYLGHPVGEVAAPARPPARVTFVGP